MEAGERETPTRRSVDSELARPIGVVLAVAALVLVVAGGVQFFRAPNDVHVAFRDGSEANHGCTSIFQTWRDPAKSKAEVLSEPQILDLSPEGQRDFAQGLDQLRRKCGQARQDLGTVGGVLLAAGAACALGTWLVATRDVEAPTTAQRPGSGPPSVLTSSGGHEGQRPPPGWWWDGEKWNPPAT